ncbi:MAG: hypothetical protein WDN48_10905 [Pseudolabrys sp.]
MSQVYGFMKQSGGHIKIYSELGEGTTIKLYFRAMTATIRSFRRTIPAPRRQATAKPS